MCFAIAPENQVRNSRIYHHWMRVASSPLRLLSFGAAIHVLILAALRVYDLLPDTSLSTNALQFVLLYGVAGSLFLGLLLTWLPAHFNRQPVHYAVYVMIYFLMFIGMGLIDIGMYGGRGWMIAGTVCILPAWMIALRAIWWTAIWVWGPAGRVTRLMMFGFVAAVAGIPLFAAGILLESSMLLHMLIVLEFLVLNAMAVASVHVFAHNRRTRINLLN